MDLRPGGFQLTVHATGNRLGHWIVRVGGLLPEFDRFPEDGISAEPYVGASLRGEVVSFPPRSIRASLWKELGTGLVAVCPEITGNRGGLPKKYGVPNAHPKASHLHPPGLQVPR
jgi:hypothetical protein